MKRLINLHNYFSIVEVNLHLCSPSCDECNTSWSWFLPWMTWANSCLWNFLFLLSLSLWILTIHLKNLRFYVQLDPEMLLQKNLIETKSLLNNITVSVSSNEQSVFWKLFPLIFSWHLIDYWFIWMNQSPIRGQERSIW